MTAGALAVMVHPRLVLGLLMSSDPDHLAEHWRAAARDPVIVAKLDALFAQCAAEIAARGPACWASGRCCNFRGAGHRLYVTAVEAALTIERVKAMPAAPVLTRESLAAAQAAGVCPFLDGHLCGVHAARPLGCRVYFCDKSAQAWQNDLYERLLAGVRAIHEEHGVEYRYAEWTSLLETLL